MEYGPEWTKDALTEELNRLRQEFEEGLETESPLYLMELALDMIKIADALKKRGA